MPFSLICKYSFNPQSLAAEMTYNSYQDFKNTERNPPTSWW